MRMRVTETASTVSIRETTSVCVLITSTTYFGLVIWRLIVSTVLLLVFMIMETKMLVNTKSRVKVRLRMTFVL